MVKNTIIDEGIAEEGGERKIRTETKVVIREIVDYVGQNKHFKHSQEVKVGRQRTVGIWGIRGLIKEEEIENKNRTH